MAAARADVRRSSPWGPSGEQTARQPDRMRRPRPLRGALPRTDLAGRLGVSDHRPTADPPRARSARAGSRRRLPRTGAEAGPEPPGRPGDKNDKWADPERVMTLR